jgi:hypothetical protein
MSIFHIYWIAESVGKAAGCGTRRPSFDSRHVQGPPAPRAEHMEPVEPLVFGHRALFLRPPFAANIEVWGASEL